MRALVLSFAIGLSLMIAVPVPAEPPPHAPAHGWRKKNDPYYQGYSGKKWSRDYGVIEGRCDAKSLGETLGKSVGGSVGGQVGSGPTREVAILVGEVIGQAVGSKVLKGVPDVQGTDRACLAQALELSRDGRRVAWSNPVSNVRYVLTPQRTFQSRGQYCRDFTLQVDDRGRRDSLKRVACLNSAGNWQIN